MRGLAILLLFNFIGLLLNKLAHVPLPGSVIGLILFTLGLFAGVVKLEWVEGSAQLMLRHMLLFFAPVVVGTIAFLPLMRDEWLAISVGLMGGFLAVLVSTGGVASLLLPENREGSER
jgi:holin-like protein